MVTRLFRRIILLYALVADRGRPRTVREIDQSIEALIQPLPEDNGRRRAIEGHHAAGDQHVHRNLGGHPADDHHLLARFRMERRVVDILGLPHIVN